MPKGPAAIVAAAIEKRITEQEHGSDREEKYISASSLAHGCLQLVAKEILEFPKPPLDPRVRRMLDVGIEGHRRIERYLRGIALAREVFFQDDEYRIKGYCDVLIYIPPSLNREHSGFYAVEIKTAGSTVFERIVDEGRARDDHRRQCMIYIWGIRRYYGGEIPVRGGIVLYENRDTLEHALFDVTYDEEEMEELLGQVSAMWEGLKAGQLPDDHLPLDHWYHNYCPYLDICSVGQEAVQWQREHREKLPDEVVARVIGERVMRKRRREEARPVEYLFHRAGKKRGERSLAKLAEELGWE